MKKELDERVIVQNEPKMLANVPAKENLPDSPYAPENFLASPLRRLKRLTRKSAGMDSNSYQAIAVKSINILTSLFLNYSVLGDGISMYRYMHRNLGANRKAAKAALENLDKETWVPRIVDSLTYRLARIFLNALKKIDEIDKKKPLILLGGKQIIENMIKALEKRINDNPQFKPQEKSKELKSDASKKREVKKPVTSNPVKVEIPQPVAVIEAGNDIELSPIKSKMQDAKKVSEEKPKALDNFILNQEIDEEIRLDSVSEIQQKLDAKKIDFKYSSAWKREIKNYWIQKLNEYWDYRCNKYARKDSFFSSDKSQRDIYIKILKAKLELYNFGNANNLSDLPGYIDDGIHTFHCGFFSNRRDDYKNLNGLLHKMKDSLEILQSENPGLKK